MKLTVSVPVYNTSRYLRKCLDSIINQTLKDLEIIIVDDGSTDGSGAICDEYGTRDKRITVIHKENGGLASARQAALDAATGDYIIVCDSDDWLEPDAYEKIMMAAKDENADMVWFGYFAQYPNGIQKCVTKCFSNLNDLIKTRKEVMSSSFYHSWSKLVRRSLFTDNGLFYEPGIDVGEDMLIFQKIMSIKDLKIVNISSPLYHYRLSSGGYTTKIRKRNVVQLLKAAKIVDKLLDPTIYKDELHNFHLNICHQAFLCREINPKEYQNISRGIPFSFLIHSPRSLVKFDILLSKILGLNISRIVRKI